MAEFVEGPFQRLATFLGIACKNFFSLPFPQATDITQVFPFLKKSPFNLSVFLDFTLNALSPSAQSPRWWQPLLGLSVITHVLGAPKLASAETFLQQWPQRQHGCHWSPPTLTSFPVFSLSVGFYTIYPVLSARNLHVVLTCPFSSHAYLSIHSLTHSFYSCSFSQRNCRKQLPP